MRDPQRRWLYQTYVTWWTSWDHRKSYEHLAVDEILERAYDLLAVHNADTYDENYSGWEPHNNVS